jgi:hypothetical protein
MAKANKEGTCTFKVNTFKKLIKKKGLTMQDISLGIGKNRDYVASCCRKGEISNKSRLEIRRKFNIKLIVEKEEGVTNMAKKEEVTIEDILSTLITDMAVKGATFDELELVTKMSKYIIDILDDYDYREFKRKYQGGNNNDN